MRIISGSARGTVLYTLSGQNTRPTLDRVKESLFNILQYKISDAVVLDLFSGSGALGLESLSRGAEKAFLCDNNYEAVNIIKRNVEKCHFSDKAKILKMDYDKCLKIIEEKFDIIFVDPPYAKDIAVKSVKSILENNILKDDGLIILETDEENREIEELNNIKDINIKDLRRYGRVKIIFLNRKG